jgi:hypothetical protein
VHVYGAGRFMAGVAKQQCRCSATEKEHGLVGACSHAGRLACITEVRHTSHAQVPRAFEHAAEVTRQLLYNNMTNKSCRGTKECALQHFIMLHITSAACSSSAVCGHHSMNLHGGVLHDTNSDGHAYRSGTDAYDQ